VPELKLIITGPPGAGKTTAIAAISETDPVRTDTQTTDELADRKAETTVAMDFGELTLVDGQKVFLYGTPGQQRFDFMWKILTEGGLGLIILLDGSGKAPLDDLRLYMETFANFIRDTGVVIGLTRGDSQTAPSLEQFYECLESTGRTFPIFDVDIRKREDVALLIEALISTLEHSN